MNKFSGIDPHSNNSVVVVSDEADRILYQQLLPTGRLRRRNAFSSTGSSLMVQRCTVE
jgi:transposase